MASMVAPIAVQLESASAWVEISTNCAEVAANRGRVQIALARAERSSFDLAVVQKGLTGVFERICK